MKRTIVYSYSRLRGRIRRCGRTQKEVAYAAKLNPATLSQKLCGKGYFRQNEISSICEMLEIADTEISDYFFGQEVRKSQTN